MFTNNYKNAFVIWVSNAYTSTTFYIKTSDGVSFKDINGVTRNHISSYPSSTNNASTFANTLNRLFFKIVDSTTDVVACYKSSYSEDDYAKETAIGTVSRSVSNDGMNVTVSNGGGSDVVINTLQYTAKFQYQGSDAFEYLLAEFELGDITIPSGQSKTWVIKPIFNAVQVS